MKRIRRVVLWLAACGLAVVASYGLLLNWPHPLFKWSVRLGTLSLYSDQAFEPAAGLRVLTIVRDHLRRSPLYDESSSDAAFLCGTPWRHRLLMASSLRAGGLNYYPATTNVFLVGAKVEENRLLPRSGRPDMFGRPLDHFITHEITHTLEVRAVGILAYRRMPDWVKEGYAEYVGGGLKGFDYDRAVVAFLADAREMNHPVEAPYLRYCLLVTHFLEHKGWHPRELLATNLTREQADAVVRAELLSTRPAARFGG